MNRSDGIRFHGAVTGMDMSDSEFQRFVGAEVVLDENDYMYGLGALRLRVARVTAMRSEPGWALVAGTRIDYRDVECGQREVVVRLTALQAAYRAARG